MKKNNKLESYRSKAGISKEALARLANVAPKTIRLIEQDGDSHRIETLHRIYNALITQPPYKNNPPSFEEVFQVE